jgi:hypothetical protein
MACSSIVYSIPHQLGARGQHVARDIALFARGGISNPSRGKAEV